MSTAERDTVPVESMTSRQLVRRAQLIEAVIELVGQVGAEAVQMRDVAERSGVALGTTYRYFCSKDHLLAAALAEWQEKLTRRILGANKTGPTDPRSQVSGYLTRALRGFHRNPEMAKLAVMMMSSTDSDVIATVDQMSRIDTQLFDRLLEGVPAERIPYVRFALDAILARAVTDLVTGRSTYQQSVDRLDTIADFLLARM